MLLLSPYGYVSRWGVRFWFQNRYFKGKYGYLSLRHSHMCTFFNVWNLAGLLSFWIYIYIYTFWDLYMFLFQYLFFPYALPLASAGFWDLYMFLFQYLFFPYALPLASAGVGGYIYGKHIISTDELIFFRGVETNHQPGSLILQLSLLKWKMFHKITMNSKGYKVVPQFVR